MLTTPVKTHVHRFGFFGADWAFAQSFNKFIITPDRGTRLGTSNIGEHRPEYDKGLNVGKQGSEFSFAGRGHNNRYDSGHAVERGVEEVGSVVSEGNLSSSFGAGVGERKAGGARVALEEHVGGAHGTTVLSLSCACTPPRTVHM